MFARLFARRTAAPRPTYHVRTVTDLRTGETYHVSYSVRAVARDARTGRIRTLFVRSA